jgi:hypothetical protein
MRDIMLLLTEMENEKIKINNMPKFSVLLSEINKLLHIIKTCDNAKEADEYFNLLAKIQQFVARTIMIDGLEVCDGLWRIFKDFDRIDTPSLREQIFQQIKAELYTLTTEPCDSKREELLFIFNSKTDLYILRKITSLRILNMAYFLLEDAKHNNIKLLKGFLSDSTQLWLLNNYSYLQKKNITITLGKESEIGNPNAPVFELTINQLNYILDRWQEALEKRPNKVIITKDDKSEIKVEFED